MTRAPKKLEIRIVSEPHWLHGRAYFMQVKRVFWRFSRWEYMERFPTPFRTEIEAKRQAEEFAKGTWVSDSATFDMPEEPQ